MEAFAAETTGKIKFYYPVEEKTHESTEVIVSEESEEVMTSSETIDGTVENSRLSFGKFGENSGLMLVVLGIVICVRAIRIKLGGSRRK